MDFDSFLDGDASQIVAVGEGPRSNFFQLRALCKGSRAEIGAVVECPLSDVLYARWYLHFRKAGTLEYPLSDLSQLIRQTYILQALTSVKCPVTYFRELGALLEDDAPKICTAFECTIEIIITNYYLHLSWDHDFLQPTVAETALGYFLDIFRERNELQIIAFTERTSPDLFQL